MQNAANGGFEPKAAGIQTDKFLNRARDLDIGCSNGSVERRSVELVVTEAGVTAVNISEVLLETACLTPLPSVPRMK